MNTCNYKREGVGNCCTKEIKESNQTCSKHRQTKKRESVVDELIKAHRLSNEQEMRPGNLIITTRSLPLNGYLLFKPTASKTTNHIIDSSYSYNRNDPIPAMKKTLTLLREGYDVVVMIEKIASPSHFDFYQYRGSSDKDRQNLLSSFRDKTRFPLIKELIDGMSI